eukprot:SAG11_NODE_3021_length_2757_cov_2.291196_3_plen_105_part_00
MLGPQYVNLELSAAMEARAQQRVVVDGGHTNYTALRYDLTQLDDMQRGTAHILTYIAHMHRTYAPHRIASRIEVPTADSRTCVWPASDGRATICARPTTTMSSP